MPKVNEIKYGREIHKNPQGQKFQWQECPKCGKPRWVGTGIVVCCCRKCYLAQFYEGITHKDDYTYVTLAPDDPFYVMATNRGRVLEHRLVMARKLGRPLLPSEIVHHKDGDKGNNKVGNLELTTTFEHMKNLHYHRSPYVLGYLQGYQDSEEGNENKYENLTSL